MGQPHLHRHRLLAQQVPSPPHESDAYLCGQMAGQDSGGNGSTISLLETELHEFPVEDRALRQYLEHTGHITSGRNSMDMLHELVSRKNVIDSYSASGLVFHASPSPCWGQKGT